MIYTKKANFPYPVLMNFTDDYINAEFEFDVDIKDSTEEYCIYVSCKISSEFIIKLLEDKSADIVLIIKSKDNQFHILEYSSDMRINIKKSKLGLNDRTVMQLMIVSRQEISFKDNFDLKGFYRDNSEKITVGTGHALGFSNTVVFDGRQEKPYDLFEKRVDSTSNSDISTYLGEETIIIIYKDASLQFADLTFGKEFNYPYIYLGLQKALSAFLLHANSESPEDGVFIDEMEPPENALESKLYSLMQAKDISELNWDNIDEVIYRLSDNIVGRYADVVRRLSNED